MKVQKIRLPNVVQPHWIVIGEDYLPVEPIGQYLLYLHNIQKSPLTIRTYAHHLKIYWEYLETTKQNWKKISIDTIANFIARISGLVHENVIHMKFNQKERRELLIKLL